MTEPDVLAVLREAYRRQMAPSSPSLLPAGKYVEMLDACISSLEAKERDERNLAEMLLNLCAISSGSGPIAPCFDAEDYEIERNRGTWRVYDEDFDKEAQ